LDILVLDILVLDILVLDILVFGHFGFRTFWFSDILPYRQSGPFHVRLCQSYLYTHLGLGIVLSRQFFQINESTLSTSLSLSLSLSAGVFT
jgi:hypothetical protein